MVSIPLIVLYYYTVNGLLTTGSMTLFQFWKNTVLIDTIGGGDTIEGVESWQEDYCSILRTYYDIQQQIKDTIDGSKLKILFSAFERYVPYTDIIYIF